MTDDIPCGDILDRLAGYGKLICTKHGLKCYWMTATYFNHLTIIIYFYFLLKSKTCNLFSKFRVRMGNKTI